MGSSNQQLQTVKIHFNIYIQHIQYINQTCKKRHQNGFWTDLPPPPHGQCLPSPGFTLVHPFAFSSPSPVSPNSCYLYSVEPSTFQAVLWRECMLTVHHYCRHKIPLIYNTVMGNYSFSMHVLPHNLLVLHALCSSNACSAHQGQENNVMDEAGYTIFLYLDIRPLQNCICTTVFIYTQAAPTTV